MQQSLTAEARSQRFEPTSNKEEHERHQQETGSRYRRDPGIGRAVAERFLSEGASVLLTDAAPADVINVW
jgi:hypothetical protein